MKVPQLITLAAALVLVGCATTDKSVQGSTGSRLSAAEIQNIFTGNTAVGTTAEGRSFEVLYRADGTISGNLGPIKDHGKWDVDADGRLCSQWTKVRNGQRTCSELFAEGDQIAYYDASGKRGGSYRMEQGNPKNL